MATCKQCNTELTGKSMYCSDSCKTVFNRNKRNAKPEQIEPEQIAGTIPNNVVHDPDTMTEFYRYTDGKVYNRPAIECYEFGTRPEPIDPTDEPVKQNRGRYKRIDGTIYQFDNRGHVFECKHRRVDSDGRVHWEVYADAEAVRHAIPGDHDYTGCGIGTEQGVVNV